MNKKEQAAFAELQRQLRLAKAWKQTEPVLPDIPVPQGWGVYTQGWTFNVYTQVVEQEWSEQSRHGRGTYPKSKPYVSASQNGIQLYSTRERALRAMRYELEQKFVQELAKVDEQVEQALTEQGE